MWKKSSPQPADSQSFRSIGSFTWPIFRRQLPPLILIVAGTACVIYGVLYHAIPVTENREEKITVTLPIPFSPGTEPGVGPSFPQPQSIQAVKVVAVTNDRSEPNIVREVTFGGVTLAEAGKIVQTYSGAKGPAFCPT